jgi:hypothetical protein
LEYRGNSFKKEIVIELDGTIQRMATKPTQASTALTHHGKMTNASARPSFFRRAMPAPFRFSD